MVHVTLSSLENLCLPPEKVGKAELMSKERSHGKEEEERIETNKERNFIVALRSLSL